PYPTLQRRFAASIDSRREHRHGLWRGVCHRVDLFRFLRALRPLSPALSADAGAACAEDPACRGAGFATFATCLTRPACRGFAAVLRPGARRDAPAARAR